MGAITAFIGTWTPSLYSTNHRIEARNVRQGGSDLLAAVPQGFQAMWAGHVVAQATSMMSGPIYLVGQLSRVLFFPFVALPLSMIACAVKQRIYESSTSCQVAEQVKYYQRGPEVNQPILGTVSINVGGQIRHFTLGQDITFSIEHSALFEKDGKMGRWSYRELQPDEAFNPDDRVIDVNGERKKVRLSWQVTEKYVAIECGNRRRYYSLRNEAPQPIQGTASIGEGWRGEHHYQIGDEIAQETPDCIRLKMPAQEFYYNTGREIEGPAEGSRTFMIEGKLRHFASAKFVDIQGLGVAGMINLIPKIPFKLPTKLDRSTVRAFEWISQHMSNVVRIALIVSGVVFLFFGQPYMAAGTLLAVSYEYLDHDLGVIPKKISLFMETWLPTISMAGLLITGSMTSQIMAATTLLLAVPSIRLWAHHKIANGFKSVFTGILERLAKRRGEEKAVEAAAAIRVHPTLEECDAPLVQQKHLTAQQIEAILAANDRAYSVNPPFLTKNFGPLLQLPKNENFTELTRLWDEIGARWLEPAAYQRLFNRVTDDNRFIDFVKVRFPEAKRFAFRKDWREDGGANKRRYNELMARHKNQFDQWIQVIAGEKGFRTKEAFIASWVREQLQLYIGKISGNVPIEGEQRLLQKATEQTAQIIPFLLKPETTLIVREDALLKLTVEGGNYCSLAMNRASREVLDGFTGPLIEQALAGDQNGAFEKQVGWELQKLRLQGIQAIYQLMAAEFQGNEEMQDTAEDVHLYEAFKRAFSRGILPLTAEEMREFDLTHLLLHQTLGFPLHAQLLKASREILQEAIRGLGIDPMNLMRNKVLEYLRVWVGENNALTPENRAALLNGPLLNTPEQLAVADNYPKWGRLFMVVTGILRENKQPPRPAAAPAPVRLAVAAVN